MNDLGNQVIVLKDQAMPFVNGFIGAVVLIVIAYLFLKWLGKFLPKAFSRVEWMDDTLRPISVKTVQYAVGIFFLIAILSKFGVETTSLIAALGAAGLAIGLALQGTLSNIAAGVMILVLRPLKVGEVIEAAGVIATVEEIGLFLTTMKNGDGLIISVPNSQIWGSTITNYSRNPNRRLNVPVGIAYDDDIDAATKLMIEVMKADARVMVDPEPQVFVAALADSSVNLTLRCWAKGSDYWPLLWDLTKNAKASLDANGFTIPFPQVDMHVIEKKGDETPTAAAKKPAPRRRAPAAKKS